MYIKKVTRSLVLSGEGVHGQPLQSESAQTPQNVNGKSRFGHVAVQAYSETLTWYRWLRTFVDLGRQANSWWLEELLYDSRRFTGQQHLRYHLFHTLIDCLPALSAFVDCGSDEWWGPDSTGPSAHDSERSQRKQHIYPIDHL